MGNCCLLLILYPLSFILAMPGITIESHHIVVEQRGRELIVTDAALLNIHKIVSMDETITFSIPKGYNNLELLNGLDEDSLIKEKDRIIDTRKIQEGKSPVAFRYNLSVKSNTYLFPLDIYYDTEIFYFLIKNLELRVASKKLIDEGLLEMGERKYYTLSGPGLKKGERIYITIHGLGKQVRRKNTLIISLILLVIFIAAFSFIFKKGKKGESITTTSYNLTEKKKDLISLLATLDEKFEKGEIEENIYRELRKENKAKLKKVMLEIEKGPHGNS